jgi:protein-disulfide isomerase
MPAARAAECAALQGRFAEFRNATFSQQDSLGVKQWSIIAIDAGVADTATFNRCLAKDTSMPRITAGLTLGRTHGVRGTPTVIVNGWPFRATPTLPELKSVIDQLLRGERPRL